MFKKIWLTLTGDWHGREVHDSTAFQRVLVYALLFAVLVGCVAHIPSCHKDQLPPHIYTNGQ